LDNLPNLIGKKELSIDSLVESSISSIRQKSSTPILLVDHAGYPDQLYSSSRNKEVENINKQQYTAYLKVKDKYDHIYYLSKQDINLSNDGTVDGVHPTDLGMVEYATAYEKAIRSILNLQKGQCKTTIACRQRREPALYEWNERYENTLSQIKEETPEVIIIGNSILHYWNGIPTAPIVTDTLGWKKAFGNKTVLNMGSGWDKIENALWRVQHGALSGYSAKQILLKIGTNNLEEDTNEGIVEGIINLAQQIKALQPEAKLTVLGLLPRRAMEDRIQTINTLLTSECNRLNIPFAEVGSALINKTSNTINEALFKDGLHPNEKGYDKLGLQLKKVID
ncbi:MAG: SGNH/GDSL hydrolase family protein, partial [Tannerellaceae bacterium]